MWFRLGRYMEKKQVGNDTSEGENEEELWGLVNGGRRDYYPSVGENGN